MTPEQHYQKAEELVQSYKSADVQKAQVHATLALAATMSEVSKVLGTEAISVVTTSNGG